MPEFEYDDYNDFAKRIAKTKTFDEIKKEIKTLNGNRAKLSDAHLNSINATTGMSSQSQRRAHSRNSMVTNYERLQAYKDALEIYIFYPSEAKGRMNKTASFSRAVIRAYMAGGGSEYDAKEYFFMNYC